MATTTGPTIGQVVGVHYSGQIERGTVIEDRGVFRGHQVVRVRIGDQDGLDAPEIELPVEEIASVRWFVLEGPLDVTKPGRDGRVFRYRLGSLAGDAERWVDVLTTGSYMALVRKKDEHVRDAAFTAGRAAVDARLGWSEPPRRIAVTTAGVGIEYPDTLRPDLREQLRSLEHAGWEVHIRDDAPEGFTLDGTRVPGGYWALLERDGSRYAVDGLTSPDEAAEKILADAGMAAARA